MADVKIDKRLNIVVSVDRADGKIVHAHCAPIMREVYDAHYLVMSVALSDLYAKGLPMGTCGRVALNHLRHTAQKLELQGEPGTVRMVDENLLPEIWRMTSIVVPGANGWTTMPFDAAISQGQISEDDALEVKNYLVFFTLASWVHRLVELTNKDPRSPGLYAIWEGSGAQLVSLNSTEFARSLTTSKPEEPSGEKVVA